MVVFILQNDIFDLRMKKGIKKRGATVGDAPRKV